jgi:hypothetical protein
MTKPREWGNDAREMRDRSAEEVVRAISLLSPLMEIERQMTKEEVIRRVSQSLVSLHLAARLLESAGAPTKP